MVSSILVLAFYQASGLFWVSYDMIAIFIKKGNFYASEHGVQGPLDPCLNKAVTTLCHPHHTKETGMTTMQVSLFAPPDLVCVFQTNIQAFQFFVDFS